MLRAYIWWVAPFAIPSTGTWAAGRRDGVS
jgi:hypothetical protein